MTTIEKNGQVIEFTHNSWIEHVSYNQETKALTVNTQRGDSYELQNVPKEMFYEFANSDSKGRFFNTHLKGKYSHEYF